MLTPLAGAQLTPLAAATVTRAAIYNNCVSFVRLEEASGTRAASVGTSFSEVGSLGRASGKIGFGVSCPDTSGIPANYLQAGSLTPLGGNRTVSFWFTPLVMTAGESHGLMNSAGTSNAWGQWSILIRTTGILCVLASPGYIQSGITPVVGTWYHVVYRFTSSSNQHEIIVNNGAAVKSTGVDSGANTSTYIGAGYNRSAGSVIDAAGIWTRVLTDAEVTQLYNAGTGLEL